MLYHTRIVPRKSASLSPPHTLLALTALACQKGERAGRGWSVLWSAGNGRWTGTCKTKTRTRTRSRSSGRVGRGRGGNGAPSRTHTHRHKTRVAFYGISILFSIQCLSSVSDPRDKPDNKQATTKENTTGRRNDGKYQGFRSPGGIRQPLSSGRQPISAARRDTSRGMARTKGISFPLSVAAAHSIKIIL